MGVSLASVNASNARRNDLSVSEGAYVASVVDDSPASWAGIQKGDVITKVGDTEVDSADSVIIALRSYDVGDKVTLTVVRGKDDKKIDVTLGSDADAQTQQQDDSTQGNGSANGMTEEEFLEYLRELMGGGNSSQQGM